VNKGAVLLRLPSLPRESPLVCQWRKACCIAPEKFPCLTGPTNNLMVIIAKFAVKKIIPPCISIDQKRENCYCASWLPLILGIVRGDFG
jgi:hypothetical protein